MSGDHHFSATARDKETFGTKRSRRLRDSGLVPGNIYGHKQETLHFTIPKDSVETMVASGHRVVDFECGTEKEKAIIHHVQWDTFLKDILHVELLRVDPNERIQITIPVVARGIAAGMMSGGVLEQPHHSLEIECLVIKMPDNIQVRINDLMIGQAIHVSDLELPEGVTCLLSPHEVVLRVIAPRAVVDAAPTEATGSEPEVVGKKEKEAAAAAATAGKK
jgi:large subunit ribosomal protein L25